MAATGAVALLPRVSEVPAEYKEYSHSLLVSAGENGDGRLFALETDERVVYTTIPAPSTNLPDLQILRCDRPPPSAVSSIHINCSGTHLALVGPHSVCTMAIPEQKGSRGAFGDGGPEIVCQSVVVGDFYHSSRILEMKWHPLSSNHLVVLTQDGVLRMYNLDAPNTPELAIRVCSDQSAYQATLGNYAVSFDFGPRSGWDWFAVYVLLDSGDVTVICPVVPQQCVVPGSLLQDLHNTTDADTLDWLKQCVVEPGPQQDVVLTPSPQHIPICQGPFRMLPGNSEDNYGCQACRIAAIPAFPTVLVLADQGGFVYLCVTLQTTQPRWKENKDMTTDTLFVLEKIDLEFPATSSLVEFLHDSLTLERVFVSHARGVHCIRLTWLDSLAEFCLTEGAGSALPDVENLRSDVSDLVCTVSLDATQDCTAPVVGLAVATGTSVGYMLCGVTCERELFRLPLRAALTRPIFAGVDTTPPTAATAVPAMVGVEAKVERILQKGNDVPLLKAPDSARPDAQYCLQKLIVLTEAIRSEQLVGCVALASEELKHGVEAQREALHVQQQQMDELQATVAKLLESGQQQAERQRQLQSKSGNLVERLKLVASALDADLPVISDAEAAYNEELQVMQRQLRALQIKQREIESKLRKCQTLSAGRQRPQSAAPTLTNQQQELYKSEIAEINYRIKQLLGGIQNLNISNEKTA
eukprot:m.84762 g.84762  ORF g.84762 m.84762 type:complete len:698 (+) comp14818_c1_seq1:161-2254(+)